MAFEEMKPKYIFNYDPNRVDSIREALQQYGEWVLTGEAFEQDYCVVRFNPEIDHAGMEDFKSHPVIYKFLHEKTGRDKEDVDLKDELLTETLLFAYALKFPELKEDLFNTARDFVTFARALNDSSKMWITCEEPFALEPLLLLAHVYPEYGYLLTSFLIPYWDDEHMGNSLYCITDWIDSIGINKDSLKAFCYCDNGMAREIMLGYNSCYGGGESPGIKSRFDLISYFRESEEHYQLFKDLLVQRYKEMPYMPYTEDSVKWSRQNPIADLVLNLMFVHYPYNTWDDDFDIDEYFTQNFVQKSAEDEILELRNYVEQKLGHPIVDKNVFKNNKAMLKYDPAKYIAEDNMPQDDPLSNWKEFIVKGVEEGDAVWNYIATGENKDILTSLPKTNIYSEAEQGYFELIKEFENFYSMESLWRWLKSLLQTLYKKLMLWGINKDLQKDTLNEIFHRLLDVLFALNGHAPFQEETKEFIIDHIGFISEEEFESRFKSSWFKILMTELEELGNYVYRENIETFKNLIYSNYDDALIRLPEELFTLDESFDAEDYFENSQIKKYSKADIAVLAVCLLHHNQNHNIDDAITESARNYLNKYGSGLLFYNLLTGTTFPRADWLMTVKYGNTENIGRRLLDDYEKIKEPLDKLEQYIYKGHITVNEDPCSALESEEIAIAILDEYLECDRDRISDKQKQYGWFRSIDKSTQKLLYMAHLASGCKGLNCSDASSRILKQAFHYGPVKTSHFLAKTYKPHKYKRDNKENMLTMLGKFKEQGLSAEGYWAYILEELSDNEDSDKNYFKAIVTEWAKIEQTTLPGDFVFAGEAYALKKGYRLLPWNVQLEILDFAIHELSISGLTDFKDELFIQSFLRVLKQRTAIEPLPVYFKNRLEKEGSLYQYIDSEWKNYPELVDQMYSIQLDKPSDIKTTDYDEEFNNLDGEKYIILQKQEDKLTPLSGQKVLWLIQKTFSKTECSRYIPAKVVVIDQSCPGEILDEYSAYAKQDYRSMVIGRTEAFLKDPLSASNAELENIFRFGTYYSPFTERFSNYFDISVKDNLGDLSRPLQGKILRLLGLISPECLEIDMDMKSYEYFDLLLDSKVETRAILKYLLNHRRIYEISLLARKVSLSKYIYQEKLADQMLILDCVADRAEYHPLIMKFEDHKSSKMRNLVKQLKEKYGINSFQNQDFTMVDYGIYNLQETHESKENPGLTSVKEPVCIEQIDEIEAELGMAIGLRFTALDSATVPKVIVHKVKVVHPVKDKSGQIGRGKTEWTQNGYSHSEIFLGWFFELPEELIPGEYKLSALDMEGEVIIEKLFNVTVKQ
ncbi:MAG: DUF3859 domain-containing protein [Spirochaetales bacterium]|nr:DUF3859 domain-containing protein [Spirochaetales bacterium]